MTGAAGRSGRSGDDEGGVSGFFHRLFGGGDETDDHGHYAEAVRRGSAVVCVTAPSSQLDQAVTIMNQHGAVDIDRRVAAYRQTGYERYDQTLRHTNSTKPFASANSIATWKAESPYLWWRKNSRSASGWCAGAESGYTAVLWNSPWKRRHPARGARTCRAPTGEPAGRGRRGGAPAGAEHRGDGNG